MLREVELAARALRMRREPTESEARLWRALSGSKLAGFKFRRQSVVGDAIPDLMCPSVGLLIEIDGDTHDAERDARRDRVLQRHSLTVVRVTNADVLHNIDRVLEHILTVAQSLPPRRHWRLPHPNPSPEGEGL